MTMKHKNTSATLESNIGQEIQGYNWRRVYKQNFRLAKNGQTAQDYQNKFSQAIISYKTQYYHQNFKPDNRGYETTSTL